MVSDGVGEVKAEQSYWQFGARDLHPQVTVKFSHAGPFFSNYLNGQKLLSLGTNKKPH